MKPYQQLDQDSISKFEIEGKMNLNIEGQEIELNEDDLEISSQDIPGWLVASDGKITVAVDIKLNEGLVQEGIAREFVNRIQNLRKDEGLEVTDRIQLKILRHEEINDAIKNNIRYICAETLADQLDLVDDISNPGGRIDVEISEKIKTTIQLEKV